MAVLSFAQKPTVATRLPMTKHSQVRPERSAQSFRASAAPARVTPLLTQQPEGTVKTYKRSGKCYSYYSAYQAYMLENQIGSTKVVYDADGQTVYIKDPICLASEGAWVKGTISGNTITVPLGQSIVHNDTYNADIVLAMWNVEPQVIGSYVLFTRTMATYDPSVTEITYTVGDETLTLNGTTENHVLGGMWSDDFSFTAGAEYATVLNEFTIEEPEKIEIPSDLTVEAATFASYSTGYEDVITQPVKVGLYEDAVMFVQGLDPELPNDWVYGEYDAATGKVTFPQQYIGLYDDLEFHYLNGLTQDQEIVDLVFYYKKGSDGTFVLTQDQSTSFFYVFNTEINDLIPASYGYSGAIHNLKPAVKPAGVEMKLYSFDYQTRKQETVNNQTVYNYYDQSRSVYVGVQGDKLYLQGVAGAAMSNGLLVGTISGSTVTFSSPQVFSDDAHVVFLAYDVDKAAMTDKVVFNYDSATGLLTQQGENGMLVNNTLLTDSYFYEAIFRAKTSPFNEQGVTPPAGAKESSYTLSVLMSDLTGSRSWKNASVEARLDAGTASIYLKGLFEELPESWVKGTVTESGIVLASGQYLGMYDESARYFIGYDVNTQAPADVTLVPVAGGLIYRGDMLGLMSMARTSAIGYPYAYNAFSLNEKSLYDQVTVPQSAQVKDYTLVAKMSGQDVNPVTVQVAIDGTDVYVRDLAAPVVALYASVPESGFDKLPGTWVKGRKTETGFELPTQAIGQQPIYLMGRTSSGGMRDVISFTYDATTDTYSADFVAYSTTSAALYPYGYISDVKITTSTTTVPTLKADVQNDDAWYTIHGQRVAQPTQKGLYIHHGKKVIVR